MVDITTHIVLTLMSYTSFTYLQSSEARPRYMRQMKEEYLSWRDPRNTGMRVSWHYDLEEKEGEGEGAREGEYSVHNRHFIRLARLIHQNGLQFGESLMRDFVGEIKFDKDCKDGEMTAEKLQEIF